MAEKADKPDKVEVFSSAAEWATKVNKDYKFGEVVGKAADFKPLRLQRFSSGILALDLALGGGWPFSRIVTLAGEYSTGKTAIAIKACKSIEEYDHRTHKHISQFPEGKGFTPGRAIFVDVEGAFDEKWAAALGFNLSHHYVARPEYAEQAADISYDALRSGVFDLIIIDSIAAMVPMKELEESTEDWQMGLQARLVNKAMRRWTGALTGIAQIDAYKAKGMFSGPMVLCLNQFRLKIGLVFGDPRVLPGGKNQAFASTIIAYTKSTHLEDTKDKESATVEFRGVVQKNKIAIPGLNYAFTMALRDTADLKKGEIDNYSTLVAEGLKYNLITKSGHKLTFNGREYPNAAALENQLRHSDVTQKLLWRSILKVATQQEGIL